MSEDEWCQPLTEIYRACIALNNMGVFLLEHGNCVDARATLKDALVLMRALCESNSEEDLPYASIALQSASRRLSQRMSRRPRQVTRIHVLSHFPGDILQLPSLADDISYKTALPIRIEEVSTCTVFSGESGIKVETAIILFNFAISQIFVPSDRSESSRLLTDEEQDETGSSSSDEQTAPSSDNGCEAARRFALKFFQFAQSILSGTACSPHSSLDIIQIGHHRPNEVVVILQIEFVVLHYVISILETLQRSNDAEVWRRRRERLENLIHEADVLGRCLSLTAASAA